MVAFGGLLQELLVLLQLLLIRETDTVNSLKGIIGSITKEIR